MLQVFNGWKVAIARKDRRRTCKTSSLHGSSTNHKGIKPTALVLLPASQMLISRTFTFQSAFRMSLFRSYVEKSFAAAHPGFG
jgi:hypothetical protein